MSELENIWKSHGYPAAERLFKIATSKGLSVTKKEVADFVKSQSVAQIHADVRHKVKDESPIVADGYGSEMQMDLLDMSPYFHSNGGNKWILIIVDIYTRKATAEPCKSKSPVDVVVALKKCIKDFDTKPVMLASDLGSEFKGIVQKFMTDNNISHRVINAETESRSLGIINNFSKFVKNALHKHFTASQSTRWLEYLQTLVKNFNSTPHNALDDPEKKFAPLTPDEAVSHPTDARNYQIERILDKEDKKKPKALANQLQIFDSVRVKKTKQLFSRGYQTKYSLEVFTIAKINGKKYELSNGKEYLAEDLLKVKAPEVKPVEAAAKEEPTPIKDVARDDRKEHKVDQILTHKEGVSQSNRREGLRERRPESQLEHRLFGKINW